MRLSAHTRRISACFLAIPFAIALLNRTNSVPEQLLWWLLFLMTESFVLRARSGARFWEYVILAVLPSLVLFAVCYSIFMVYVIGGFVFGKETIVPIASVAGGGELVLSVPEGELWSNIARIGGWSSVDRCRESRSCPIQSRLSRTPWDDSTPSSAALLTDPGSVSKVKSDRSEYW